MTFTLWNMRAAVDARVAASCKKLRTRTDAAPLLFRSADRRQVAHRYAARRRAKTVIAKRFCEAGPARGNIKMQISKARLEVHQSGPQPFASRFGGSSREDNQMIGAEFAIYNNL
jgi:hypothetical protein